MILFKINKKPTTIEQLISDLYSFNEFESRDQLKNICIKSYNTYGHIFIENMNVLYNLPAIKLKNIKEIINHSHCIHIIDRYPLLLETFYNTLPLDIFLDISLDLNSNYTDADILSELFKTKSLSQLKEKLNRRQYCLLRQFKMSIK